MANLNFCYRLLSLFFIELESIMKHVGDQLRLTNCESLVPIEGNVIIVPVAGMTNVVENSLNYAKGLSPDQIIAVYVSFDREDEKNLKKNGRSGSLM